MGKGRSRNEDLEESSSQGQMTCLVLSTPSAFLSRGFPPRFPPSLFPSPTPATATLWMSLLLTYTRYPLVSRHKRAPGARQAPTRAGPEGVGVVIRRYLYFEIDRAENGDGWMGVGEIHRVYGITQHCS